MLEYSNTSSDWLFRIQELRAELAQSIDEEMAAVLQVKKLANQMEEIALAEESSVKLARSLSRPVVETPRPVVETPRLHRLKLLLSSFSCNTADLFVLDTLRYLLVCTQLLNPKQPMILEVLDIF